MKLCDAVFWFLMVVLVAGIALAIIAHVTLPVTP